MIRKVSGKPYDAFLHERVFKPLGMQATRHDSPDEIIPDRAVGYLWQGGALRNGEFLKYMTTNHGDRGILSTALDLAKWDIALETDRLLTAPLKDRYSVSAHLLAHSKLDRAPIPRSARKLEAVLKAFAQGGKSVEDAEGIAPQARKDYSRGPSPELSGIQSISFIAGQDVSDRGIERHAGKVTQVLYYKLVTDSGTRHVLVYLTATAS